MESLANEAFRDALTSLVLWLIGVYVQLPGPLREVTDRVILENIGFFSTCFSRIPSARGFQGPYPFNLDAYSVPGFR